VQSCIPVSEVGMSVFYPFSVYGAGTLNYSVFKTKKKSKVRITQASSWVLKNKMNFKTPNFFETAPACCPVVNKEWCKAPHTSILKFHWLFASKPCAALLMKEITCLYNRCLWFARHALKSAFESFAFLRTFRFPTFDFLSRVALFLKTKLDSLPLNFIWNKIQFISIY
jgi:hypothetical protein